MDRQQSIFRQEAIRRYQQRREQAVFPRLVLPRTFLSLWLLFGLVALGAVVAALTPFPTHARGVAVVMQGGRRSPDGPARLALLLPPESMESLKVGRKVFLSRAGRGETVGGHVSEVIAGVLGPGELRERFGLQGEPLPPAWEAAAVAIVEAQPAAVARLASGCVDDTWEAQVETGSAPLLRLMR